MPPTAATAARLDMRPLSPALGMEVRGLDLRRPLDTATRDALYQAFVDRHLLCFRDQDLSKQEQVAFSRQFGELEQHTLRNRGQDDEPLVHVVSNLGPDGKPSGKVGSTQWHTDKSFRPLPSLATILHARTLPPEGGDTCFVDMIAAFEDLDAEERADLERHHVVHSWELSRENIGRVMSDEEKRDAPTNVWPLVRTHPDSGRKCLFVGMHASHLEGLPLEEGRGRIEALEARATEDPRFVYRHVWRPGDMLMWDNRCLLHRAVPNFDAAAVPRVLHRTCLRGTAPA